MSRTALTRVRCSSTTERSLSGRSILSLRHPLGLLGEGEGDERGGLDSFGEKAHGALSQDLGLTGACAGDDLEDRAVVGDGFVLGGGELFGHGGLSGTLDRFA